MNKMKKSSAILLITIITISIISFNIFGDTNYIYYFDDADYFVQHFNKGNGANSQLINSSGTIGIYDENNTLLYSYAYGNIDYPKCMYHKTSSINRFTTDVLTSSNIQNVHAQISIINQSPETKFLAFQHYLSLSNNDFNYYIYRNGSQIDGGTIRYVKNGYIKLISYSNLDSIFGDFKEPLHAIIQQPIPTPNISINNNVITWENPGYNVEYSYRSGQTYVGEWSNKGATFGDNKPNSWTINDIGYYRIKFLSSDPNTTPGEWSNIVYYNGENLQHLPTPSVYYDSVNNQFTFSNYDSSYQINMYIDGRLNRIYQNANNIQANASGNYQFQYSKSGYVSSNTNNPINVILPEYDPIVPVAPSVPTEPTTSNIFDWIKYYGDYIGYYIETIVNGILNIFKNAINSISSFSTYINQFINSFGDLFVFLPQELKVIFISVITIALLFVIIKFIRS